MKQGDVFWYRFAPPDKRRPVLVLTRSPALEFLNRVVVAAITTTIRDIPTEVRLSKSDGMPSDCVVNLDNAYTVNTADLSVLITSLSRSRMREVSAAIEFALGFREMSR